MKLLGLHIENYGPLADFSLGEPELAPNPCLVYGLNEAGKTTLLSFIRAVLFGFRTEGELARPVQGGHPGGHLLLEAEGVVYRIQRRGAGQGRVVVETSGETTGGEEILRNRLLRGVNPVLFRNIFAFGVHELRRLDELTSSEVSVYIYGAGTGTNPGQLASAAATLDKRAGALFKPRGRVQIINGYLRELAELERQIRVLEQQPRQYLELKQEIATLEQQQAETREVLLAEQRRLDLLDKLMRGRKPWHQWQTTQTLLEREELVTDFPQGGLERLEVLLSRREEKKEQWRDLEQKVQDIAVRLADLTVDDGLLEIAPEVEELYEQRALYRDKMDTLPGLLAEVSRGEREFQEKLVGLGPDWDETRVLALDTSWAVKNQLEEFDRRWREQEQKSQAAANLVTQARRERDHRQGEQDYLARQLAAMAADTDQQDMTPEAGLAMLEQAASELERQGHLEEVQGLKNHRLAEIDRQISRIQGMMNGAVKKQSWGLLLLLVVLVGLAAGLLFWQGRLDLASGGLGLVLLVLVYWAWTREGRKEREQAQGLQEELAQLETSRRITEQELEQLAGELNTSQANLNRAAQVFTGGETLTPGEIPGLRRIWQEKLNQQRKTKDLALQLERAGYNYNLAHTALAQAQKEQESCSRAWQELEQEWLVWLAAMGLPELFPAAVIKFLNLAEQVVVASRRLQQYRARAEEMKTALGDYEKQVHQLAKTVGQDNLSGENVMVYVTGLYQGLREQQRILAQRRQLSRTLEETRAARGVVEQSLARLEEELSSLLTAGGARDEEEFRRREALYQEQVMLTQRARGLKEQLLILAGSEAELTILTQELGSATEQEHQEEYRSLNLARQEKQAALDDIQETLAARRQEIKALEKGEELARARQKREMLRESLASASRQWQTVTLCSGLLEKAREKHERERQPAVLDLASRWFATMTRGRYVRVVAPVGAAAKLAVEKPGGGRLEAACLSRGAAGQLYLAVRLALACHFSRMVVPLPVILDDPLVDFDGPRLRNTVRVLGQVARELQVILLTCHQHLLEVIREELVDFSLVEMGTEK